MKLYADEPDADIVREMQGLACASIARVEVPAALWRKHRAGDLDPGEARLLVSDFEADYYGTESDDPRFVVVKLDHEILQEAARLTAVHALRAYDAVQLASALAARAADEDRSIFVAFDSSLVHAAAAEGFETNTSSDGPAASG